MVKSYLEIVEIVRLKMKGVLKLFLVVFVFFFIGKFVFRWMEEVV